MTGSKVFLRAWARRLGAAALVLGVLVTFTSTSSQASLKTRLQDSKAKLSALTTKIKQEETQMSALGSQLAEIDQKIAAAAARFAAIDAQLASTRNQIAAAQTQYDALQVQLGQMARNAYEQGSAGPLAPFLTVVLGSSSMGELSDRLEYLSQASQANVNLADHVAVLKAQLTEQANNLNHLLDVQAQLLTQLSQQRQQKNAAITQQQLLLASLDRTRTQIVALVGKLRKELKAREIAGIGQTFQGNNNAPYGDWASLFLRYMGEPTCHKNLVVLLSWQVAEFTQAAWNPLATTWPMPGSTTFNWAGVQNFVSLAQGLQATKATIQAGLTAHGYGSILSALSTCSDPMTTADAIRASDWCAGCAGGVYVVDVVPKVEANYHVYASL